MIRKFKPDDILKIKLQKEQEHEFNINAEFPETTFTIETGKKILGVFGVVEIYAGRGEIFSFISADAGKSMIKIVRSLQKIISQAFVKTGFERLEMSVLEGFDNGDRLAGLLGFEYEGLMRKYYKGKNYKLYARIK